MYLVKDIDISETDDSTLLQGNILTIKSEMELNSLNTSLITDTFDVEDKTFLTVYFSNLSA